MDEKSVYPQSGKNTENYKLSGIGFRNMNMCKLICNFVKKTTEDSANAIDFINPR